MRILHLRSGALVVGILLLSTLLGACGGASGGGAPAEATSAAATLAAVPTESPTLVSIDLPPTATTVPEGEEPADASTSIVEPIPPAGAVPATQVLTVAVNAEFEPFLYKDEAGNLAGIDIDLLQAIGSAADLEMAFVDTTFADVLEGVADGRFDIGMAAITVTPERAERMLFTEPYFSSSQAPVSFLSAGQGLAVPIDSTIAGVADLTAETRVGVKEDTTGAEYAEANLRSAIQNYPEAEVMIQALLAGEVDAIILDNVVLSDYIISNPETLRLAGGPLAEEEYAIAVKPGGEEIVALFDGALETLRADGTYQAILDKWLAP